MPARVRVMFSAFALMFLFTCVLPLVRELSTRDDIWWTPREMLVPLARSGDRVEIFVRGQPIAARLQAGQLRIADGAPAALAVADVGLRFNNWDRVRAQRLPLLLFEAAGCGVAATLFLLILLGRLAYRGEREREPV